MGHYGRTFCSKYAPNAALLCWSSFVAGPAFPSMYILMVDDNEFFISQLAKIGVQMISVHPETANHCHRTLSMIHEIGSKAGIALGPSTPLNVLEYLTDVLDFVVIMTVNPGFSGQRLVGSAFRKIADCRTWITSRNLHIALHVDGNVSFENIPEMVAAGADTLVAGTSSLFAPRTTRDRNMTKIKTAMQKGLRLVSRDKSDKFCGKKNV